MKKLLKAFLLAAAMTTAFGFFSCSGDDGDEVEPTPPPAKEDGKLPEGSELITVTGGQITWDGFEITDYTKYAKVGSKLHLEVENGTTDGAYCKVLILNDWVDSGVTEAHFEGDETNSIGFETTDDKGNACHRPYMEGEGEYYFVLNEAALSQSKLFLYGNATVKKLYIEYVGGKKTEEEANPPKVDPFDPEKAIEGAGFSVNDAKDTFTYKLAWAPATKANVQLVFQNKELPVADGKAEAGHDFDIKGTFALKLNEEVIWTEEEKTFTVTNNAYGDDYILKTNILADKELKAGDVITLTAKDVKVLAKDETDAGKITKITTTIIDDSEAADWWKDILNTKIEDNTLWTGTAEVKEAGDDDPTDSKDPANTTEIWTGTLALNWDLGDNNGTVVASDKFTATTKALKFTFTTDSDDGDLQVMAQELWTTQTPSKIEGDYTDTTEEGKNVKLAAGKTNGTVTVYFEGDALNAIVTNGIKFFGNAATITKVEIVEGEDDTPADSTETAIMETETVITWSDFCIVTEKFAGTEPKTITIYYDCPAGADYTSMKIGANYSGAPLGDGTIIGATLKADDKGAMEGLGAVGSSDNKVSYTPTAEEWAQMVAAADVGGNKDGLYINGFGVKITKITLK
ncbi:MAG: hypothetical protein KBT11_07180 [Treponema sp.]|nr:hypothetical protein [Candidatus Treponema equifaecale]